MSRRGSAGASRFCVSPIDANGYIAEAKDTEDLKRLEKIISEMIEDAKLFDPEIEIKEVETINGEKRLAFIGNIGESGRDFWAFRDLRNQQRTTKRNIEQGKDSLNNIVDKSQPNYSKQPKNDISEIAHNRLMGRGFNSVLASCLVVDRLYR